MEKIFCYIFDFFMNNFSSIVTLTGIILGYLFINRKFIESNIASTLNLIQEFDRKTRKDSQILIDDINRLATLNTTLEKKTLQVIFERIEKLYYQGLDGSSESLTYLHLLKMTLQSYINQCDGELTKESPKKVYYFIISVLDEVILYSTQAVPVPKSISLKNQRIVDRSIASFFSDHSFKKYRYFNTGVIRDRKSSHFIIFYEYLNHSTPLMIVAASKVLSFKRQILVYLYRKSIYAPIVLQPQGTETYDIFNDNMQLELIGIQINKSSNSLGQVKNLIQLKYKNAGFVDVVTNLREEHLTDYYDITFPGENTKLRDIEKFEHHGNGTFTVTVNKDLLEKNFNNIKSSIKRKLKK